MKIAILYLTMMILTIISFALPAMAAEITLAWDNPNAQDWDKVELYNIIGQTYNVVYTVTKDEADLTQTHQFTLDLAPGSYTFVAKSYMDKIPSVDSNVVTKTLGPDSPILRIIVVKISPDGIVDVESLAPAEFFRPLLSKRF